MRMLAEQETSSSAGSARPALRMEILAEGGIVASIPIQEIGVAGGLCFLSALVKMLLRRMRRRSSGRRGRESGKRNDNAEYLPGRKEIMSAQAKKRKNDPESVRRRLENSLPWSLSRWFSRVIRGKDASRKR